MHGHFKKIKINLWTVSDICEHFHSSKILIFFKKEFLLIFWTIYKKTCTFLKFQEHFLKEKNPKGKKKKNKQVRKKTKKIKPVKTNRVNNSKPKQELSRNLCKTGQTNLKAFPKPWKQEMPFGPAQLRSVLFGSAHLIAKSDK